MAAAVIGRAAAGAGLRGARRRQRLGLLRRGCAGLAVDDTVNGLSDEQRQVWDAPEAAAGREGEGGERAWARTARLRGGVPGWRAVIGRGRGELAYRRARRGGVARPLAARARLGHVCARPGRERSRRARPRGSAWPFIIGGRRLLTVNTAQRSAAEREIKILLRSRRACVIRNVVTNETS